MSKLVKGIIIGAVASGVIVGAFVPMGEKGLSLWDRINEGKEDKEEV